MADVDADVPVQLVFSGECKEGCDPQAVRLAVAAALKLDEVRTARLFCGRPIVLQRSVDVASAMRHIARFSALGAVLRAQPLAVAAISPPVPLPVPPAVTAAPVHHRHRSQHPLVIQGLSLAGLCAVMFGAFVAGEHLGQGGLPAAQSPSTRLPVAAPGIIAAAPAAPAALLTAPVVATGVDEEVIAQLSPQAAQEYQRSYLPAKWHRAFAVSDSGAHAWVSDLGTEDEARAAALQRCMHLSRASACRVMDVNGQPLE